MTLGDLIRTFRREHNLTMEEFGRCCGLSKGYISMLEKNENPRTKKPIIPSLDTIRQVATGMQVDINDLIAALDDNQAVQVEDHLSTLPDIYPIHRRFLPLLADIACGEPIYSEEQHGTVVDVCGEIDADFCVKARGDSMTGARIYDGDLVFIKRQPTVENGEIAAVWIDGASTLKRFYMDENEIRLAAENPKYPTHYIRSSDHKEVLVLGKAVAFQSALR